MNRRFLNMTPSSEGILNITIVDNTPTGASTSPTSLQFIGKPNDAFSTFNRTITRDANYILTSPTASVTGDTGGNVSISATTSGATGFQNGDIEVSGTIPSGEVNVTLTLGCTIAAKASRGCSVGGGFASNSNGGGFNITMTFGGGGTASAYHGGTVDEFGSYSGGFNSGSSGTSGANISAYNSAGNGSLESMYTGFSISENATHASCDVSHSRTY